MIDLLRALLRGVFMLAAGLLVLFVAAMLLMFTLAFVLVAWVRGVLVGQRPTLQSSWVHVQQSAASAVWRKFQRKYQQPPRPGQHAGDSAPGAAATVRGADDVVDVDFRETPARPTGPVAPTHRIETDRHR